MLREKIAALTSNLASQIILALEGATVAELVDLGLKASSSSSIPKEAPLRTPLKPRASAKRSAPRKRTKTTTPAPMPKAIVIDERLSADALAFFNERGRRGATSTQLDAHLAALGFPSSSAHVFDALVKRGAIRDAGFRRATGNGNATLAVFVLANE